MSDLDDAILALSCVDGSPDQARALARTIKNDRWRQAIETAAYLYDELEDLHSVRAELNGSREVKLSS